MLMGRLENPGRAGDLHARLLAPLRTAPASPAIFALARPPTTLYGSPQVRSVAQPGSALDWGSRGRGFRIPPLRPFKNRDLTGSPDVHTSECRIAVALALAAPVNKQLFPRTSVDR